MDIVVTVPRRLWEMWLDEGALAYMQKGDIPATWSGDSEYGFNLYGAPPRIEPGQRVYIVAHGKLRGYSPLIEVERNSKRFGGSGRGYALVRHGDAVAVTIDEPIRGFRGFRYRWWNRADEKPFLGWTSP